MPDFKTIFEDSIVITKYEGREINPTVLGLEFIVKNDNPYYKKYIDFLEEWKHNILNTEPEQSENYEVEDYYTKYIKRLKEDLQNSSPKITVKIELENNNLK